MIIETEKNTLMSFNVRKENVVWYLLIARKRVDLYHWWQSTNSSNFYTLTCVGGVNLCLNNKIIIQFGPVYLDQ